MGESANRFGRYELLGRIGVGGMAEVFLARSHGAEGFHKNVVVKRILPQLCEDQVFQQMFVREAKTCVGLEHPNIVQVFDLGRDGDQLFMVMELVKGPDLARVCRHLANREQTMPIDLSLLIMSEVLEALGYAHARSKHSGGSVIHRDVSPCNVMLSFTGEVKLGDFGIAKAATGSYTRDGIVKGKLLFMPHEQLTGGEITPQTDLYSAGMVLHQLLSGRHPFSGAQDYELVEFIRTGRIPTPSSLNPAVSPELDRIVMHAVSFEPEDRYPDAQTFLRELQAAALAGGHHGTPSKLGRFLNALFPGDADAIEDQISPNAHPTVSNMKPVSAKSLLGSPTSSLTERPWLSWGLAIGAIVALVLSAGFWLYLIVTAKG